MERVHDQAADELTTDEKRRRIREWYFQLNTHSKEFGFFVPLIIQLIVDVGSSQYTSAFEALDRASPEQIDRLWHRYLLAQMVS